jgi:hypothetical protein
MHTHGTGVDGVFAALGRRLWMALGSIGRLWRVMGMARGLEGVTGAAMSGSAGGAGWQEVGGRPARHFSLEGLATCRSH